MLDFFQLECIPHSDSFVIKLMLFYLSFVLNVFFVLYSLLIEQLICSVKPNVIFETYCFFLINVHFSCFLFRFCLSLSGHFQGMLSHDWSVHYDMGILLECNECTVVTVDLWFCTRLMIIYDGD